MVVLRISEIWLIINREISGKALIPFTNVAGLVFIRPQQAGNKKFSSCMVKIRTLKAGFSYWCAGRASYCDTLITIILEKRNVYRPIIGKRSSRRKQGKLKACNGSITTCNEPSPLMYFHEKSLIVG